MTRVQERFTATLKELRPREVASRRLGRFGLAISGPEGAREVIVEGPQLTIGAHEEAAVVVHDDAVSNMHCELRVHEDAVVLRDLGSKNGTWIGDVRVHEVTLPLGGSFGLGGTTVTLRDVATVEVPMSISGRFADLHGRCSKMGELFATLERIAAFPIDVLVCGETGTGKELVARGIHECSDRKDGPFVVVDCTSLNEGIAESMLFGHERGSFTGAVADRAGLLEEAEGGTLFLDELGELPMSLQPKLLRALEQRQTRRIGETRFRTFDARVVAATNRDLPRMVGEGRFREDLYFRIAQVAVEVPPLRVRGRADIAMLADLFLARIAEKHGRPLVFADAAYDVLASGPWPGNVRQLRNAVQYAVMVADGGEIGVGDLPPLFVSAGPEAAAEGTPLEELARVLRAPWLEARRGFERAYVTALMERAEGNQSEAARIAGMNRSSLRDLLKRVEPEP